MQSFPQSDEIGVFRLAQTADQFVHRLEPPGFRVQPDHRSEFVPVGRVKVLDVLQQRVQAQPRRVRIGAAPADGADKGDSCVRHDGLDLDAQTLARRRSLYVSRDDDAGADRRRDQEVLRGDLAKRIVVEFAFGLACARTVTVAPARSQRALHAASEHDGTSGPRIVDRPRDLESLDRRLVRAGAEAGQFVKAIENFRQGGMAGPSRFPDRAYFLLEELLDMPNEFNRIKSLTQGPVAECGELLRRSRRQIEGAAVECDDLADGFVEMQVVQSNTSPAPQ